MGACQTCGRYILFGGVEQNGLRYCSEGCVDVGEIAQMSEDLPPDVLENAVRDFHLGPCPRCGGPGPNDVVSAHRVWSLILLSNFASPVVIGCRRCGTAHIVKNSLITMCLGWWGFPFGLFGTPVQLIRNLFGLGKLPTRDSVSPELVHLVKMNLTSKLMVVADQLAAEGVFESSPPSLPPR